jgi:hypothetical protein
LKIIAVANALLVTAAFVGCPARKDSGIIPSPIATEPPPKDRPPPPFVTIAPYGGNFQQLLPGGQTPLPPSQDSNNDKRSP